MFTPIINSYFNNFFVNKKKIIHAKIIQKQRPKNSYNSFRKISNHKNVHSIHSSIHRFQNIFKKKQSVDSSQRLQVKKLLSNTQKISGYFSLSLNQYSIREKPLYRSNSDTKRILEISKNEETNHKQDSNDLNSKLTPISKILKKQNLQKNTKNETYKSLDLKSINDLKNKKNGSNLSPGKSIEILKQKLSAMSQVDKQITDITTDKQGSKKNTVKIVGSGTTASNSSFDPTDKRKKALTPTQSKKELSPRKDDIPTRPEAITYPSKNHQLNDIFQSLQIPKTEKNVQSAQQTKLNGFVTQVKNPQVLLDKMKNMSQKIQDQLQPVDVFNHNMVHPFPSSTKSILYNHSNHQVINHIQLQLLQQFYVKDFVQHLKTDQPAKSFNLSRKPTLFNKTVVFDLDETLIHCNENLNVPYDVKLEITFPTGDKVMAGINIRPFAKEILSQLTSLCEVIVFTASHQCYASKVLDYLDPTNKLVHHRLYRDSCSPTPGGIHIKDLRVIANRDLKDVILVDNAAYSYGFQIENGIPIIPFYNNKKDEVNIISQNFDFYQLNKELVQLLPYIKSLLDLDDIRPINKHTFKLEKYLKFETAEEVFDDFFK